LLTTYYTCSKELIIGKRERQRAAELQDVRRGVYPRTVVGSPDIPSSIPKSRPDQDESFISYFTGVATVLVNLIRSFK
jgi:hypothetical protein